MKLNKKWIVTLAIIVIVLLLSIPKLKALKENTGGANTRAQGESEIPVEGMVLKAESFDTKILTTGTIMANEEVELRSEISGKIVRIYFSEGSRVQKGDLLIKINDAELQAQLQKAQFRKKLAEDKLARTRRQLEIEAVSQETYDNDLNELNVIKSELNLIRAQIDKTEIRAPFNGYIGLKFVSEGSYISPSTKIATLVSKNPVKIDFSIPERYAGKVQTGDKIYFKPQGREEKLQGEIYAIEPKVDTETRTLQLRGIYENKTGEILPGAFVEVELVLETSNRALLIPTEALVPEIAGQSVFLYKKGKAVSKRVETGQRTERRIQITEGLQAGDTLITTGILQLRQAAGVSITEFN